MISRHQLMQQLSLTIPLIALFCCQQAFAFGALAIDSHKGDQYGWAIDYKTYDEAQKRAMSECGEGCRIVFIFSKGAAAYAADQTPGSTIYGWGRATTGAEAKAIALNEARKKGATQPVIRAWGEESQSGELVTFATREEHQLKQELEVKDHAQAGKQRVLVYLDLRMKEDNSYTRYCGITSVKPEEMGAYKEIERLDYAIEVMLKNKQKRSYLVKSGESEFSSHDTPVYTRFLPLIRQHSSYAQRAQGKHFRDVYTAFTHDGVTQWRYYAGDIVMINESQSAEELNALYCDRYVQWSNQRYGKKISVVDFGDF